MDTWTLQPGFPLITLKIGRVRVKAVQERFLEYEGNFTDPNTPLNSTIGYKWHVPLTYICSENPVNSTTVWMNVTDGKITFYSILFYSFFY